MKTITIDGVNCYLISTEEGFVLVDTGYAKSRAALERELEDASCLPGTLKLILITHGDFDHTGSAAYLRAKYGAKIAMHQADAGMVEQGDMLAGRKMGRRPLMRLLMAIMNPVLGIGKFERFTPDICLADGADISGDFSADLSACGFHARVLHVPGHSKGSLAFLTQNGDLFCGDLLENTGAAKGKPPALNSLIDELSEAMTSVEKLRALSIQNVYPGHGPAFTMQSFLEAYRAKKS